MNNTTYTAIDRFETWQILTSRLLYFVLDLGGIFLKLCCLYMIKERSNTKNTIHSLTAQYLIGGVFLCFVWILLGWMVMDFESWLFVQQVVETLPYNFFQICWAFVAYLQRIRATNPKFPEITSKSLRIRVSVLAWVLIICITLWKFLIDGILPTISPEFEDLIGRHDERTIEQKMLWVALLSAPMTTIEVSSLINYLILKTTLERKRKSCNVATGRQMSAISSTGSDSVFESIGIDSAAKKRRSSCQLESEATNTNKAIQVMLIITLVEDGASILWLLTPFSHLEFLVSTVVIAILNNFVIVYVSVRNFGTAKEAINLMKREILKN